MMPNLNLKNKFGFLSVEYRADKGIVIGLMANQWNTLPQDHMALNEHETLTLTKWLVAYINVGKGEMK
jgi:hypothetical protein